MQRILIKLIGLIRRLERRKNLRRLGLYHLSIKSQVLAKLTFGPFVDSKTNILQVGEGSLVRGNVSFVKNGACLLVGNNTAINGSTSFSIASNVEIGNNVLISFDCLFMDHDGHSSDPEIRESDLPDLLNDRPKAWETVKILPIRIEDSAWVGARSTILKGVTIGQGAIVAAGSVVTKSVSPFVIVAGNPARQVNKVRRE